MAESHYGRETRRLAAFWRLSLRTAQKLTAAGVPLGDTRATIMWVAQQPAKWRAKATKSFLSRVTELRIVEDAASGGKYTTDPLYAGFLSTYQADKSYAERLADLKRMEAYARYLLQIAQQHGDRGEIQEAGDRLDQFAAILRREEAADAKLGREVGDQLPRSQIERDDASVAAALFRAIDAALPGLCRDLLDLKHPEFVRLRLEPVLLNVAFLRPLAEAGRLCNDHRLPAWRAENFLRAAATYLESGREQLSQSLAQPAAPPSTVNAHAHEHGEGI